MFHELTIGDQVTKGSPEDVTIANVELLNANNIQSGDGAMYRYDPSMPPFHLIPYFFSITR